MSAEDCEIPVPKFTLTDLGLNYINDTDLPKTLNPKLNVKYDWSLSNFLLEITIQQGEHVSRHIVTVWKQKELYYISIRTIIDIVFQTCGRSQRLKMMEMIEEEYKKDRMHFLNGSMIMMEIYMIMGSMRNFVGTDKRVSKYVAFNLFDKTCCASQIILFIQANIQNAIDNALSSLIKHVSWNWPYYEHTTSEHSQQTAIDDIEEIKGAIMHIFKHGKYHIRLDKSCLGDFIKQIADFYNQFPNFDI